MKHIPHVIVPTTRAHFYRNILAKDFHRSFDNLEAKTGPVGDASAPLVRSVVGPTVEELADEIAVGPVN